MYSMFYETCKHFLVFCIVCANEIYISRLLTRDLLTLVFIYCHVSNVAIYLASLWIIIKTIHEWRHKSKSEPWAVYLRTYLGTEYLYQHMWAMFLVEQVFPRNVGLHIKISEIARSLPMVYNCYLSLHRHIRQLSKLYINDCNLTQWGVMHVEIRNDSILTVDILDPFC